VLLLYIITTSACYRIGKGLAANKGVEETGNDSLEKQPLLQSDDNTPKYTTNEQQPPHQVQSPPTSQQNLAEDIWMWRYRAHSWKTSVQTGEGGAHEDKSGQGPKTVWLYADVHIYGRAAKFWFCSFTTPAYDIAIMHAIGTITGTSCRTIRRLATARRVQSPPLCDCTFIGLSHFISTGHYSLWWPHWTLAFDDRW